MLRATVPGHPTLGQGQELCCFSALFLPSVPGLDYVSHEDILPYTSTDQVPIQHELFERFLLYDQTKGNLSQEDKLERDSSFFEDNIIEVISKLYFHNLIQPRIRPVQ